MLPSLKNKNEVILQGVTIELPIIPADKKLIAGWDKPQRLQRWERTLLPESFKKLPREKPAEHLTDDQWAFIDQEFKRREEGYWFYNNGVPTWITGLHYFFLNWWKIDIGYPKYRSIDRDYFYFWDMCVKDNTCYGMVEVTRRRNGKSFRGGVIVYEYISRTGNANGGIQSKTDRDALKLFQKAIVSPWRKLPFFFKPNFDSTSNPKKELRFFAPARKGSKITSEIEEDELESQIDARPSNVESYDGDKVHRYFGDEEGKTKEISVDVRWETVKKCLQVDGDIIGKAIHTTTVEEMESGGGEFKKLWDNSSFFIRNENGQTLSGLYRYFQPAYTGYKIDEYGNDLIEESKAEQQRTFDGLKRDRKKLASEKRKMPWTEDDMFRVDAEKCHFDSIKLQDRLDQINSMTRPPYTQGDFRWENNIKNTKVEWHPCLHNVDECQVCKFLVAHIPKLEDQNQVLTEGWGGTQYYYPKNQLKFSAGCDPFQNKIVLDEAGGSKASLYIKRKFDPLIDTFDKMYSEHVTNMPVVEYLHRPKDIFDFYDDVIKVLWFYGCEIFPESNKVGLKYWLQENGYQNFLIIKPEGITRENDALRAKQDGGATSTTPMISHYTDLIEFDVNENSHKYPFPRLIKQLLEFDNSQTQKCDAAVGWGFTLVGCQKKVIKKEQTRDIHFVKLYDNLGNRIN